MKRLLLFPAAVALAFLCWLLWPRGEPGLPVGKAERVRWECFKGREIKAK